ncbi:MAG TPA: hypothetical protein VK447_11400 [Myxococcaceae bacterium]|nr:hypothetical protein [Myxococcaceae bacterium]
MGFVKGLLFAVCFIGVGIGLATVKVEGRTSLQHAERAWERNVNPSMLDKARNGLDGAMDEAKDKLDAAKDALAKDDKRPRERHSAEDREAVNKLIAKRAGQK